MDKKEILDIFYNYILKEAANETVNCFIQYNSSFSSIIEELYLKNTVKQEDSFTPTLIIKDMNQFNYLLTTYVELASNFYSDDNYYEEVLSGDYYEEDKISKEKTIMTLLWSNATYEDFNDPISFLRKRINYLSNQIEGINLGYSNLLDGEITIEIEKDKIVNETPYAMHITLNKEGKQYQFPKISFGIDQDTVDFYAITNPNKEESDYNKKVNRKLYKVNEGFDKSIDNDELYGSGNLSDITTSFVVAADIALSFFQKLGYYKFNAASILPVRWNAKRKANEKKSKGNEETLQELENEQLRIQTNLTEKFLRTWNRVVYHHTNLEVVSYPFEQSSNLKIKVKEIEDQVNNPLLNEIKALIDQCEYKNRIK